MPKLKPPQHRVWPKHAGWIFAAGLTVAVGGLSLVFTRDSMAVLTAQVLYLCGGGVMLYLLLKMEPRTSEQRRLRRQCALIAFLILVVLLAMPFTVVRPMRNERMPRLRITERDVTTMGIGQAVVVNIHVANIGDETAEDVWHEDRLVFAKQEDADNINAVFREIHAALESSTGHGVAIPAGGTVFYSVKGPLLERSDFVPEGAPPGSSPQVFRNGAALLVASVIRYRGSGMKKEHRIETCFFTLNPNVNMLCRDHNVH